MGYNQYRVGRGFKDIQSEDEDRGKFFRDLKDILRTNKIMNKKQENMVALVLLAYVIGFLVGEKSGRAYSGKMGGKK